MTNHLDQLAHWWDNAEKGIAKKGDLVISRNDDDGTFDVHTISVDQSRQEEDLRILQRAPEPKPAWRDAVAVVATHRRTGGGLSRGVFANVGASRWQFASGGVHYADELTDVTPLIEARITDDMVERAEEECVNQRVARLGPRPLRAILTAALGIEDE